MKGRGFSLIELLVVTTIVSMLAALLFPLFAQSRHSAQRSVCLAQIRQLGLSWAMYAADADEAATPAYYFNEAGETAWDFRNGREPGLLFPYIREERLWHCPTFRGKTWGRKYTGYAYNTTYIGGDFYAGTRPTSIAAIGTPSSTIVFADAAYGSPPMGQNYLRAPSDTLYAAGTVHFRHLGFANTLWADLHARFTQSIHRPLTNQTGALSEEDEAYDLN